MNRHRSLDRQNRRALAAGLGISVALHAAVLAWGGIGIPAQGTQQHFAIALEAYTPSEAQAEPVQQVVMLEAPTQPVPAAAASFEAAASSASAGAAAAPASAAPAMAIAAAGAPNLPAVAAVEEVTFDRIAIVDPLSSAAMEPVAFTDLPEAETTAPPMVVAANIPVHEPGAVGKAKRKWAGSGTGESAGPTGAGFTIGVAAGRGGHCPMPGRGGVGPYWIGTVD
jgi:hypothetical protein